MDGLVLIIVSLTTLISFFFYKKFKETNYRCFLYYLLVPFFTEILHKIIVNYMNFEMFNPIFIYNLYTIFSFIFFFTFYKVLSKNKTNKKIFKMINYVFIGFIFIDVFIFKESILTSFNVHLLILGSVLLLTTLILFLIEIINNNKIIFNISKSFIFWISIGLLLFYVGILPIMITREFLNYNGTYTAILVALNIIMYGSFVIGMVKSDTKYNY